MAVSSSVMLDSLCQESSRCPFTPLSPKSSFLEDCRLSATPQEQLATYSPRAWAGQCSTRTSACEDCRGAAPVRILGIRPVHRHPERNTSKELPVCLGSQFSQCLPLHDCQYVRLIKREFRSALKQLDACRSVLSGTIRRLQCRNHAALSPTRVRFSLGMDALGESCRYSVKEAKKMKKTTVCRALDRLR